MPTWIIKAAIVVGLVLATKFLAPKAPKMKPLLLGDAFTTREPREIKQLVRSSISPHRIIYGETVVSGTLVAVFNSGTNKEFLHMVVALAGHECQEISDVWLGDDLSTVTKFTSPETFVWVYKHLGSTSQTYDINLAADISQWTSAHRLQGICYLYIKLKWDANVWLSGIPNIKAKVKGQRCYDPRTQATAWTNNATLCQLDYILSSFGIGESLGGVNEASWISAANICDENVALGAGGTQKRYTCDGSFTLDQKPIDIMNSMATASVGVPLYRQGKYYGNAGAWIAPTVTLDEDDLRGEISFQSKPSRRENYNAVKGTFIDSANFNAITEFIPKTSTTYEADDGGTRLYRDLELPFTTNNIRAQRIAQIHLEQSRAGILHYPAKLTAFNLAPMDTVKINNTLLGWTNKTFRVIDWSLSEDYGVDLVLQEDSASVWAWTSSQEGVLGIPPTPPLPNPYVVTTPTGLTLTSGPITAADTGLIQINVGVVAPPNEFKFVRISAGSFLADGFTVGREITTSGFTWAGNNTTKIISGVTATEIIPTDSTGLNEETGNGNEQIQSAAGNTILQQGDGTILYRIKVAWTLLLDQFVTSGGYYEVQYRKSTDSVYSTYMTTTGIINYIFITGVKNAIEYDVRIRAVNIRGVKSLYATVANHLVANWSTAPATPTGLSAAGYATSIGLVWVANAESDIAHYEITRATDAGFTTGLDYKYSKTTKYVDELGTFPTTRYYRIKAINKSGVASTVTSGVSAATDGITTARINNNAVTTNNFDHSDAFIDPSGDGEITLGTFTLSTDGGNVAIIGKALAVDAAYASTYYLYIRKDNATTGTIVDTGVSVVGGAWQAVVVAMAIDNAPAASQTYFLRGQLGGYNTGDGWSKRRLVAFNLKK